MPCWAPWAPWRCCCLLLTRYSFCPQVKEFFSSLEEKGSQLRCVQQALDTIQDNIQWMDRNLEELRRWLHHNQL